MGSAGDRDDPSAADAVARLFERGKGTAEGSVDPRLMAAWRTWLSALANDAEAALAAAMAYGSLPDDARAAWLAALDADAEEIEVPKVALYAPLLAVETDPERRTRITQAMGSEASLPRPTEALKGVMANGEYVCVVLSPLYLQFVELLICRYHPDGGIAFAHYDPLRHAEDVGAASERALGEPIDLDLVPLCDVVEELAHAVMADRREGRDAPHELARFSHLFGPDLAAFENPTP